MGKLRNETSAAGAGLRIFTVMGNESLQEQVRNVANVCFMIGIHGALSIPCLCTLSERF